MSSDQTMSSGLSQSKPSQSRLPHPYGLYIDRDQTINFSFEGKTFTGLGGDNIASALAANQQYLLSRSFKYHRPRGILTMAGQDANTLVQLPSDPNVLADKTAISEGLVVKGQNYTGSLARDFGAWVGLFSRFLPVGFYYKTFFKPRGAWELWSKLISRMAGLGKLDPHYQPADNEIPYDKQYRFYDCVVIGAGPAGMQAAIDAAQKGEEVLLLDENPQLGGSLNYGRLGNDYSADRSISMARRIELINEVNSHANIEVMLDCLCNGWFSDNWLAIIQGKRLYKTRAKQVIMAVGTLEQQALFHNNDLPGIMMSSAAQRLMHGYAVKPGNKAVVLTGNIEGYSCALDLAEAGVTVQAIVDLNQQPPDVPELMHQLGQHGIKVYQHHALYQANAAKQHLASVEIRAIDKTAPNIDTASTQSITINCDLLCMAIGTMPCYQLPCHAGAKLNYDDDEGCFSINQLPPNVHLAGAVAEGQNNNHPWPIFPHPQGKEFVDYDEDLQIADIVNATKDGYEHVQLVKRYSTCGMGPSQGRHSALAAARLIADTTNRSIAETGVTTARPPFAPERLGHNAGRSFYPARRSSIHYLHLEAGAIMLQAGPWYRPAYYLTETRKSKQEAINAEVMNVRSNVGLVDVSTLGGLEIRGPDAAEFINRIYTFGFLKQPVGKARYALMCNEAGVVIDDGVACRLSEQHFYVTATTGGVDAVYRNMLKWNAQWRLDVDIANVTAAYCGINIAGPFARKVLESLCRNIDLDNEAFPYMGVREGHISALNGKIPVRVMRVGFVGELGFEIHALQQYGEILWSALMQAGQDYNIQPFGIEAQRVLRLEKGHIIIGQDTDAMSNPMEIQMSWALSKNKPFFVGGRTITELQKATSKRVLAGFIVPDNNAPIPLESHLIIDQQQMVGRVTSCYYSPTLGKAIGLAYMPPTMAAIGNPFIIKSSGGIKVWAEVVETPFYDPKTLRQLL